MTVLAGLVRSLRPKQWMKNLLVFAAPAAAGVLNQADQLGRATAAFVAFSLASGGLYLFNDLVDRDRDRHHPVKRQRPIASRMVSTLIAASSAIIALLTAAVVALLLVNLPFSILLAGYVANTVVYTLAGKHEPVVDVVQVSVGFILRALGGALAAEVTISVWFAVVAMFGSLLMVVGKRLSEVKQLDGRASVARPILDRYPLSFLQHLHDVSTAGVLLAYSLWAFEAAENAASSTFPWFELSIGPMVVAIFRYDYMIDKGQAQSPEDALLSDRLLLAAAAVWAALVTGGIYA